jgi:hypothetical protein
VSAPEDEHVYLVLPERRQILFRYELGYLPFGPALVGQRNE